MAQQMAEVSADWLKLNGFQARRLILLTAGRTEAGAERGRAGTVSETLSRPLISTEHLP